MAFCSVQDMRHPNLPQVLHILDRLTVTKNDARINLKKKSILELELFKHFKFVILIMAETIRVFTGIKFIS